MILRARWVLGPDGSLFEGGVGIERDLITGVHVGSEAVRRATRKGSRRAVDLGDGLLAPGFVNAHAHLELGSLAGKLTPGEPFVEWLRGLIRLRGTLSDEDFVEGIRSGSERLVETGTTTVGDIASAPVGKTLGRGALRSVVYREVFDAWDPARTEHALRSVRRALPGRRLRTEGVSPHAPYTTSPALLDGVRQLLLRRPMPVSIHWAETRSEVDWLERGEGGLAAILPGSRAQHGPSGLDCIEEAGLLGPATSLVHGNCPAAGDAERLARAGVSLVHCPGSHAFFDRASFDLATYRRAGVRLALGTDSLASNLDLDMAREMALLRRAEPGLAPLAVFAMGTAGGAHALGLGDRVGAIRVGALADLAFHHTPGSEPMEALTQGMGEVAGVWVGGREVFRKL